MKKLLVTSALPYANGPIHIGHLVEYVQTDIWVRYWRLRGRDAIYLCADDTHGTPIMMRATSEGIEPMQLIDRVWHEHRRDFAGFQILFDNYYTTHSPENQQLSSEIYRALRAAGHIVERTIEQSYCTSCKMFLPDRFIRGKCPSCGADDQYGDSCEVCSTTYTPRDLIDARCAQCGMEPLWRESSHLFFRLGDFAQELKAWLRAGHVQEEMQNKMQEWFTEGLKDWDISRDAPYFGFEIPDKPGKYFYVWLDAPVGYMASTMDWCRKKGQDFDSYWRNDEDSEVFHFIGKDIVYFHALFWPAMLMGSGFRTPSQLCVHGFLTVNHEKMSKSRGTFITAESYLKYLDPQYLRYYYATKLNARVEDLDWSLDDFVLRVNADLVNKIANIPSRVLAILHRDCAGQLGSVDEHGREWIASLSARRDEVAEAYENREFGQVTRCLGEVATEINVYLQDRKPWQLAGENPESARIVCTVALNAFKIIAILLAPILPEFADKVARMLKVPALAWDDLDNLLENRPVEVYERLVDRVDRKKVDAMIESSRGPAPVPEAEPPKLTLDSLVDCEFQTLELIEATPVPEADKLVALKFSSVDGERDLVAGLGADALNRGFVGKPFLVLTNLQPKKIRGRESNGMLLATEVEGLVTPVIVPPNQAPGIVE
ncbi:MAG: methionine--tRNA ligase [Methylococcales bacterium]